AALAGFVEALYGDEGFQRELDDFARSLEEAGWVNALAQKLVQLTAPGVPDLYQGTELWDLSLVDPDNRRPVDFALRRQLLLELDEGLARSPSAGAAPEAAGTGTSEPAAPEPTGTGRSGGSPRHAAGSRASARAPG